MIHLGDVTKISGYDVPPVDVVIGGSPCQDLSVAGKRAGLSVARSGLFMEQIRIIREMRDADVRRGRTGQFIRPRFMVWENVPGAFSSNKGDDFRAVLEETIRAAEPDAPNIPLPPKGKWPLADCWMGDGWSVAYRVLDAQFWGVPQRRRRIALVADFGGHAAPEILFVRESVCGDPAEGGAPGEEAAAGAGGGAYPAIARSLTARHDGSPCVDRGPNIVFCLQGNTVDRDVKQNGTGIIRDVAYTLDAVDRHFVAKVYENHGQDSRITGPLEVAPTVASKFGTGGNNTPLVMTYPPDVANCLKAKANLSFRGDADTIVMATGQASAEIAAGIVPTLNCGHEQPIVTALDCRNLYENQELSATLQAKGNGGQSLNYINPVRVGGVVRRLTPLECERLQGLC